MAAAYCPRPRAVPLAGWLLPGAVGAGTRPAALELPDLGSHVDHVDSGGDEGDDRQDRDKRHAVRDTGQAHDGRYPEDDQPQLLGLLARRGEGPGRPAHGVDEGPRLDDQGRQHEDLEEPEERGQSSGGEHAYRISAPAGAWAPERMPDQRPRRGRACQWARPLVSARVWGDQPR